MRTISPFRTLSSRWISASLMLLMLGPLFFAPPAWAGRKKVDPTRFTKAEIRALEKVLDIKVAQLLGEKTDAGNSFKRGSYSRSLKKIDELTCKTVFHLDTAIDDTLRTERYLLTLKRDALKEPWSVTEEEKQDTYEGLFRSTPGDEEFFSFESFNFAGEGLSVSGTAGSFYTDTRKGDLFRITIRAADLKYTYKPPIHTHRSLYSLLDKQHHREIEFTPERIDISCDPTTCSDLLATAFTGASKITRKDLSPRAEEIYHDFEKQLKEARRERPFAGFARPYETRDRYYSVSLKKKGFDHFIYLENDSREPREVSFWVSGFGTLYSYNSEATRAAAADPSTLERRPDFNAREYELRSLVGTVEMGFGDGELLKGDIEFGLRSRKNLREVRFTIARLRPRGRSKSEIKNPRMRVNSIQDGGGNELTWVRTGSTSGFVILPEEVPAGTDFSLRVDFENQDSIYKFTPSYSYVARGGWLPFVRFGDMIDQFDLTVKVPFRYTTLGVGKKVSQKRVGDASVTRWVAGSPVVFPTVIFGKYQAAKSRVKATKLDGTEIPVTMYVDKVGMGTWEIAPKALPALADEAANSLNLYREIFGVDYPFDKLDLVNDPLGALYGQAPSSLVYLGSASFWSKGVLGSVGGANFTKFVNSLVAHEVGHQWWGSSVANANSQNYWFVESLAEYSSSLYLEAVDGIDAYLEHVQDWRKEIMDADLLVSVQDAPVMWGGERGGYRAAVYSKGPYAFHIMRSTWGDKKLFAFLKSLAQELEGKEIVTRDIQKIAEKSYGIDMEWFFDQWIRGVGIPEYTMTYTVSSSEDGSYIVEGKVSQVVMAGSRKVPLAGEYFQAMVPITVEGKDGKGYKKKLIVEGPETRFRMKVPTEPKKVLINKNGEVLSHDIVATKL
jgi:hypothetical protein